ncbi:hypothetical protein F66182_5266 [Fusarium sp. NRRL 66182]|nr:hypothetical protein F66182_5266 [Fusarium sp. NRRL 66182]
MTTTQTTLEALFEAIPLESRSQNNVPVVQQEQHQAGRVFEAVPSSTASPASRWLITALLFTSNAATIAGGLVLSRELGRDAGPGQANWMVASYPLTQGAFVLVTGRLGAIYGHKQLTLIGCTIFTIFSLANGFCKTHDSFITMRALTGVGGGVFMPNAVSILTTMTESDPRLLCSVPSTGWAHWRATCRCLYRVDQLDVTFRPHVSIGLDGAVNLAWLAYTMPKETPVDKGGHIDLPGILMGLGSLLLFNVVCNLVPSVGWNTPYEIALLMTSVFLFVGFLIWERRYAKEPIMPLSIFGAPTFTALVFVVLLSYMAFGVSLWYSVAWQQLLRGASVLQTGYGFAPFGFSSLVAVFVAAWLIPRVAAQWIMAIGVGVTLVANVLLATMPAQQTYWAQIFPAMILCGFCPDLVFVAAQVIASNSVSRRQQGVASSLIGTLNLYGNSLGQGFAGTIETEIGADANDEVKGYRAALYFAAGLALLGLVLDIIFVRMPKDEREGWDDPSDNDNQELGATTTAAEVDSSA